MLKQLRTKALLALILGMTPMLLTDCALYGAFVPISDVCCQMR